MKNLHNDWLWILVRKYVNKRDAGKPCISCGRIYERMDCGHFYGKGAYPHLKYDETNIHRQCRRCNIQGNIQGFRAGLIARYGLEYIQNLELKARIHPRYKLDREVLMLYYKQKLEQN